MRVVANECSDVFNYAIADLFGWDKRDRIEWLSPIASDKYAEYYDQEFLERLGILRLKVPLSTFWPPSGPRWDGLAKTGSGKFLLVEAKAYIEEAVDYRSRATDPNSIGKIRKALKRAQIAFRVNPDARWDSPFYQYANRLAHLYFMRQLNGLDAYLLFLYFADAPDVPEPSTAEQWRGAERVMKKCLGLTHHPFSPYSKTLIWSIPQMSADTHGKAG